MADKDKPKVDLGLLEEDDEFEEFPAEGESGNVRNCFSANCVQYFRLGWHQGGRRVGAECVGGQLGRRQCRG